MFLPQSHRRQGSAKERGPTRITTAGSGRGSGSQLEPCAKKGTNIVNKIVLNTRGPFRNVTTNFWKIIQAETCCHWVQSSGWARAEIKRRRVCESSDDKKAVLISKLWRSTCGAHTVTFFSNGLRGHLQVALRVRTTPVVYCRYKYGPALRLGCSSWSSNIFWMTKSTGGCIPRFDSS